jgi:hypothetical protein
MTGEVVEHHADLDADVAMLQVYKGLNNVVELHVDERIYKNMLWVFPQTDDGFPASVKTLDIRNDDDFWWRDERHLRLNGVYDDDDDAYDDDEYDDYFLSL